MLSKKKKDSVDICDIHTDFKKKDIGKIVITSTDSDLLRCFLKHFDTYSVVNKARGQIAYSGYYCGRLITLFSTGMGIFPTLLYSEILYKYCDVDYIIKVDTCYSGVHSLGEDVVAKKASMSKGLSKEIKLSQEYECSQLLLNKLMEFKEAMPVSVTEKHHSQITFKVDNNCLHESYDIESAFLYAMAHKFQKHAIAIMKAVDTPSGNMTQHERSYNVASLVHNALGIVRGIE